ncbi:phosphoribosylamine--glycine ligase [Vibrio sp. 10N.222.51.E8]|uniref:capsular polysaccharide export protein, LipB/KpsS family n=1 Tax=unclassified Vibrio TaxID=2614977 RepID=UPI0010BDC383|nr:phosphoribosylamine--glycine ligase [Vibrio sp. F13]TKG26980.1 phosphoribosylamine--glycine ligase [Vibrio sp. F13]
MINNKYNLLSLDPMYSPLHERVASILAKKKYAIVSCFAMNIYLPSFKCTLATSIIKDNSQLVTSDLIDKIRSIDNYHSAYVKKIEGRSLNSSEVSYMAAFYLGLRKYLTRKKIDLVIVHNDTRWYHAVAIHLCKEMGIKYLVTEQGLIRPNTTVIDDQGINYKAKLPKLKSETKVNYIVKNPHDSLISVVVFGTFLTIFNVEKLTKTRIKYLHTDYSLRKYFKRTVRLIFPGKFKMKNYNLNNRVVLLLLQLEMDSQILMYSEFNNNQNIITKLEKKCSQHGLRLIIKKHPLDDKNYFFEKETCFVDGGVKKLSEKSEMVFTVNSSAALQVLRTDTPLYLLGDSIYDREGIAKKVCLDDIDLDFTKPYSSNSVERKEFLDLVLNDYLIRGAGFSFDNKILEDKLCRLLSNNEENGV